MADKLTRKELKQPDAFQKVGAEARDWLQARSGLVAGLVAVILVVGAGLALARYFSERGEEKASKALGGALKVLNRPVSNTENPEPPNPDEKEPPFKSEKEKNEAVVKTLTEFRAQHGNTQAAATAALPLAQAEYQLGEYDKAIADYQSFLKGSSKDETLRATAYEGIGYSYEAKKDYAQALATFQDMSKENTSDFLAGMGMYHQARILVLQGKKEEAAKVLSDLTTAHPGTAAARMASDRLTVLASEGVKIPTPTPAASGADAGR